MAKTIPLVECWKFVGSTPKKYEGRKRYVSTGALEKDHINEADVENVTYEERPSRANLEAVAGDILFAKMASTEKTFVVDDVSAENIYSTGFCAVRADETKILPKCLYYFLSRFSSN
jgi:type I restriction enzyme S subunit